jgi:hypothetical protein
MVLIGFILSPRSTRQGPGHPGRGEKGRVDHRREEGPGRARRRHTNHPSLGGQVGQILYRAVLCMHQIPGYFIGLVHYCASLLARGSCKVNPPAYFNLLKCGFS